MQEIFNGNSNTRANQYLSTNSTLLAARVRIVPLADVREYVCLRLEFYGCFRHGIAEYSAPVGKSATAATVEILLTCDTVYICTYICGTYAVSYVSMCTECTVRYYCIYSYIYVYMLLMLESVMMSLNYYNDNIAWYMNTHSACPRLLPNVTPSSVLS